MKITQHIHQQIRFKSWLITLIILSVLICFAWLSRLYTAQFDLSANASNTLTKASQKILTALPNAISVTGYIQDKQLQKQITQLINKYQRFKKNIELSFVDPTSDLENARKLEIDGQGAIIIEYEGNTEKLTFLDESTLSNTLLQLANTNVRWVTFITGHRERSPSGQANFDLGLFGKELEDHKIYSQTINLVQLSSIPDNSSLVVLATPDIALLQGETNILLEYIEQGGNLLLLTDPNKHHLNSIEHQLGIRKLPGTIIDSNSSVYGIDDPTYVLISEYNLHPITANFNSITVFPVTSALEIDQESDFKAEQLLISGLKSWTETAKIAGKVRFDPDSAEQEGPLTIAYALTRTFTDKKQQRIIVIGDGDFLSNSFLGNVGNSELGFRMINWLTHDDQFIEIPAIEAPGKSLHLSTTSIAVIGLGFLVVLPILLLLMGLVIWRRRKRR